MKFLLQTLILCMILCVHTNAQHTIQTVKKDTEWLDISPTTKLNAKEFVQNKKVLSLSESHTLELVSTLESRNGYRQYRYRQTYKGIPIEGADYIVHEKNAHVKKVRDKTAKNINLKTQPTVNESTALQTALHHIGATRYAWQDENYEAQLKKVKADAHATFYPTANLVFFNPNTKSEEDYRLAYRFNIYATEPMRRAFVYIDANNGKKLAVHDIANFADKAVSGMTNYHGEVDFTAHKSGNKYICKNEIGGGIEVLNSNNTEGYPNNEITESDAYFDQDPTAVDVLWASEETYNYFSTVHQWKSFDNADMRIVSWIHYGENYPNAFWNDSWMTFGDGNGSTLLPYTSIDIVAHEFTHGITTFSSGLIYDGESGALSESFSDIFGEIIENKALHDRGGSDWIAGGDIVAIPGLRGSRNLANPKDPTMRNRQPDTYKGEFWYEGVADYGGAHTNNGVQNYWFHLLAFGGIGVNDNGFAYSMEGIGVEKAAQITFNNLISLSRYDGYAEARAGAIVAAEMLYGIGSDEALQTAKAWCAVGVGDCYKDDCRILDSLALVDVYHASNGQNWDITWNLNTPIDSWYGVTLDDLGCVSNLSLNNNNLTADIAPQIGNLRHLKELYLNENKLISLIPATVGKLDSLEIFEAWGNTIGGALPSEIGGMTNLRILNLSFNNIVSPIPAEIGNLDNLTHLLLNVNPLSGPIPAAFGNFNSLSYLNISNCHFTGVIPAELGNLTNLTELILTNNRISGAVPDELSNLPNLNKLELDYNKFTFGGLENIVQAGISNLIYNPQDSTYILQDENGLYVNSGATIANDTYIWYKDGGLFATITGDNYLPINTTGRYRCEVINNMITNPSDYTTDFILHTGEVYAVPNNPSTCRLQDSLALIALYHATNGDDWRNPWNFDKPLDTWTGITMGADGCVEIINLFGNNLIGTLPPEIGHLTHVRDFNVSNNSLYHVAPEIGNMSELTHLYLNLNTFNQNIPPEIGQLTNLEYLDLSYNHFTGDVPTSFSNLSQLWGLVLTDNKVSGTIPASLPNLSNLYTDDNNFNFGAFEHWAGNLDTFRYAPQYRIPIYKNGNTLSVNAGGTLSNNTYRWYKDGQQIATNYGNEQLVISESGYYSCNVSNNALPQLILYSEGTQVFSVSDLPCRERDSLALVELYHATNGANWTVTWDLNQPIHTWHGVTLSNVGCVDKLDLRDNGLTGTLPNAIGDITEMTVLYMHYNGMTGQIPPNIGNLTNLEIIDLGDNYLSGAIPGAMSNMRGIKELSLQRNELSGEVPASFWEKADLEIVRLFKNKLTGTLPPTIGQLVNVRHFSIGNNNFTGTIPPEIGQMINLKRLSIFDCGISGNIPPEIANLSQLTELVLHGNELTGTIPPELGQLENLIIVRLNDNKLSGEIPFDINQLNQLNEMWIDRNNFTFNQIEEWVATGAGDNLDLFRYAPQAEIPLYVSGDTLYVEAGGTMTNNTYHWFKDGVYQTTIHGNNKYLLTSSGFYHCTITNSIATDATIFYTDLRLKSESVYVETFVWPGDFNANGIVEMSDVLFWGFAYGNNGSTRPDASPDWYEQYCPNWEYTVNDINGKHQDGNGNGIVDEQDLDLFRQNFGNTRPNATIGSNNNESPYMLDIQRLSATPNGDGTITREYGIYLNSTNGLPVSLHGIDFTLEFSTSGIFNPDKIIVNAENSFLNPDELVVISNHEKTQHRIAATKKSGINMIGEGFILGVVVISDDIAPDEPTLLALTPKDIEVLTINTGHEGNEVQLIPVSGETFFEKVNKLETEGIPFQIYPNPAEDYIHIDIQDDWENGRISIYDVSGKLLIQQVITSDNHNILVEDLSAGMYILRLNIDDGRYATKRFIVK